MKKQNELNNQNARELEDLYWIFFIIYLLFERHSYELEKNRQTCNIRQYKGNKNSLT